MGYGIPVVAAVRPQSEVARLIARSGAGWVTDSPEACAAKLAEVLQAPDERRRCGEAGLRFAQEHFSPEVSATAFETVLTAAASVAPRADRQA